MKPVNNSMFEAAFDLNLSYGLNSSLWHNNSKTYNGTNSSEDYYYDYDQALDTFYWGELVPPLVIYSITFVIGIVGNCLITYTIARFRRLKSTTNVFLASLASADLLVILICIPVKLARLFSYTWNFGMVTCKMVYYVQSVSAICSVLTLTSMSVERYYAIVYPMKAQYQCTISKAKRLCSVVWFLSFILASPTAITQTHMKVGERRLAFWCVKDFDSVLLWPLYETYLLVLVLLFPAGIMAVAYYSIYTAVCDMAASRKKLMNYKPHNNALSYVNEKQRRKESHEAAEVKQVVTMLVVVVFLFILCWAPILILNVLKAHRVIDKYSLNLRNWATASDLLSYCNSCVNPVVYGFMSRNFRASFRQTLCCHKFHRRPSLSSQMSLSTTRLSVVRRPDLSPSCHKSDVVARTSKTYGYRSRNYNMNHCPNATFSHNLGHLQQTYPINSGMNTSYTTSPI